MVGIIIPVYFVTNRDVFPLVRCLCIMFDKTEMAKKKSIYARVYSSWHDHLRINGLTGHFACILL